jgi:hypothetical protein
MRLGMRLGMRQHGALLNSGPHGALAPLPGRTRAFRGYRGESREEIPLDIPRYPWSCPSIPLDSPRYRFSPPDTDRPDAGSPRGPPPVRCVPADAARWGLKTGRESGPNRAAFLLFQRARAEGRVEPAPTRAAPSLFRGVFAAWACPLGPARDGADATPSKAT